MGKVKGQGHRVALNNLSTGIPFVPCQSALPFLGYDAWVVDAEIKD